MIDVVIPAVCGIACLLLPVKETGDAEQDKKRQGMMRLGGAVLLVVAFGYGLIKFSQ